MLRSAGSIEDGVHLPVRCSVWVGTTPAAGWEHCESTGPFLCSHELLTLGSFSPVPRVPFRRAVSTPRQHSPGAERMGPEAAEGQRPVSRKCSSAQRTKSRVLTGARAHTCTDSYAKRGARTKLDP